MGRMQVIALMLAAPAMVLLGAPAMVLLGAASYRRSTETQRTGLCRELEEARRQAATYEDSARDLETKLRELDAVAVSRRRQYDAAELAARRAISTLEAQLREERAQADRREIAAEQRGRVEGARIAAEALRVDAEFRAREAASAVGTRQSR